jgi:lysophospholipase L1-like esterase
MDKKINLKLGFEERKMNKKKLRLLVIGLAILALASAITVGYMLTQNRNSKEAQIWVACVGDSLTGGTEYPNDLWMMLGSNYSVGNFGVGGSTVSLSSWKPYLNEAAFQKAKEFHPNIVVIMLGTNDANPYISPNEAGFVQDYIALVDSFKALSTKPKINLVLPPPIFSNQTGANPRYFAENIIPNIKAVANQTDLQLIDVYSALMSKSDLFADGVHPNAEGAKLIAQEIYQAIK